MIGGCCWCKDTNLYFELCQKDENTCKISKLPKQQNQLLPMTMNTHVHRPLMILSVLLVSLLASLGFQTDKVRPLHPHRQHTSKPATQLKQTSSSQDTNTNHPEWDLNVAIAGAGPSALLLAHRLLKSNLPISNIDMFESRADPRSKQSLGGRAYALGLGMRGRTAIRTVDEELWTSVKTSGFGCERFRLHFNSKWNIKLRDDESSSTSNEEDGSEPSVLIYQTDLCGALLDELDRRSAMQDSIVVKVHFNSTITHVDLSTSEITIGKESAHLKTKGPYDLIVGCDGANSIVRSALELYSPPNTFIATQRKLYPGCFKVCRLDKMPPLMDPKSVALVLPESMKTGVTAFVEPTVGGGSCILFAGRMSSEESITTDEDKESSLSSLLFSQPNVNEEEDEPTDSTVLEELIIAQFPLLKDTPGMKEAARQLISQRTNVADSVKCNIFSSSSSMTPTAICGDAAHATGGVSGQGCNSALVDVAVLVDCLSEYYHPPQDSAEISTAKKEMLHKCLSSYSQKQVPEGAALYDLSFGNDGKTLPIFRNVRAIISNAVDSIFRGRLGIGKQPLQTLLASSVTPFVEIRRERQKYYIEEFPSDGWFKESLEKLYL